LALLAACLYSFFCACRFIAPRGAAGRPGLVLAGFGVAALALGCRLGIAEGHVSWAPYLDQWNAEISGLVAPLAHGRLGLADLLAANNEHRVVLTRAVSLAAVEANGGWDNRITVIATFLLESAAVAWVSVAAWSVLGWLRGSLVSACALLPMLLVCDWENVVSGFQDQFAMMVLGSVVALSLGGACSLRSRDCRGALVISVVVLGSLASGLLTAAAMAGSCLIMALGGWRAWRSCAGYLAACGAVTALGWFTRHPFAPMPSLYAQGVGGWASAFLAYAAWPLPAGVSGFACLWLPWLALLAWTARRRPEMPFAPFALGLGLWVLLQAGVLAWSRAGLSGLVSSRYTEVLAWAFVANAASIAVLVPASKAGGRLRTATYVGAAIWLASVGAMQVWRSRVVYRPYFENFRAQTVEHERRLAGFAATGDAGLIRGTEFPHIPGSADEIVALVGDAKVRALLPGPIRRPAFGGPLAKAAARALQSGGWFVSAGLALLAAAFLVSCARPRQGQPPGGGP
jgi:hypothetical protein